MKLLFAAVMLSASTALAGSARPNILFCISDDQSYPHAGAYGCAWVKTPAFDRIAREGLLFDHAYTPNAKCAPSRACILTGRNSWQLEAAANHAGFYPAGYRGFMEGLGVLGYFTGFTGKGWAPGEPGVIDGQPRQLTGRAYNALTSPAPTKGISPIDYAKNFAAFLKARPPGQPFCFWYGGHEPHRRYEPGSGRRLGGKRPGDIDRIPAFWPDSTVVRDDMLDYAFEIEHFDRHLAAMLEQLARAGELENTIIVVTADNGMPFPRAKGANYSLSHHLPLAIRWGAGIVQPGRRVGAFVSFIDFAATFLDVAGATPAAAGMEPPQGRSLRPVFRAEPRAEEERRRVFIGQERHDVGRPGDVGYPVRGIFESRYLYLRNFEPARWPMCDPVTGYLNTDGSPTKSLILTENRAGIDHWRWELNFGRRPSEELYDLSADPDCLRNLAADPGHAAERGRLRELLEDELRRQRDPRILGQGAKFDRYPYGAEAVRDFYNRYVNGHERLQAGWVNAGDFESPDFDPERPLAPRPAKPGAAVAPAAENPAKP